METYTVALALEDFLPTLFSSIGLWFIWRSISQLHVGLSWMAFIGWLAITLGGLFKAIWKLSMALSNGQLDIVMFDKGLFVWLGLGFLLMVYAWSYAQRIVEQRNPRQNVWFWPSVTCALFFAAAVATGFPNPARSTWRFIFLGLLTISNITFLGFLINRTLRLDQKLLALLFALNLIVSLILSGLARIPNQTIALQWAEQLINTIAQAGFCYGAWQLHLKGFDYGN